MKSAPLAGIAATLLSAFAMAGPIIDRRIPASVPATPAVSGFTAAGTLGTTDPTANISY